MTSHTFLDLVNTSVLSGMHSKIETAYVQTTNNTATTLWSVVLAELTAATFFVLVNGKRDDDSEGIGGTVLAAFRRASAGNVTLIGSVTTVSQEDSSGTPSVTMDADTGSQTARLRVTGETSKTFDWYATIIYQYATF